MRLLRHWVGPLALLGFLALPQLPVHYATINLLVTAGIFGIAALGLDLLKGYTGMLSLGHGAFMGIGAYATAILTAQRRWEPLAALLLGIAVTLAAAWVIGVAVRRLSGYNLALATMALSIIAENLFLSARGLTGGGAGITGVANLGVAGLTATGVTGYFYVVWLLLGVLWLLGRNLARSRVGRALLAVHHDPLVAEMSGIDTDRVRLQIFMVSAAVAALAGSLYAHSTRFIAPGMVGFETSVVLLTMVILGGEGTLVGPVLGAVVLKFLPEYIAWLRDYQVVLNGLILLYLMIYLPGGLAGVPRRWQRWLSRRSTGAGGVAAR